MLKKPNKTVLILVLIFIFIFFSYYNNSKTKNKTYQALDNNLNNSLEIAGQNQNTTNNQAQNKENKIIVHLSGAVREAGVYELNENARLIDLIEAAGGLDENADLEKVNLAEALFDGEKIIIPEIIKEDKNNLSNSKNSSIQKTNGFLEEKNSDLININKASQLELEELSGIGPGKSAAIIKYRNNNGIFRKKEDLINVSGIGEKTLEKIEEKISLK